jgi:hypothetical protein
MCSAPVHPQRLSEPIGVATAIVSGAIANKPGNGGEAWVRLSWLLGLRRLGFDVYFVEQIAPGIRRDASGSPAPLATSVNAAYFKAVMAEFGLTERAGLLCDDGEHVGLSRGRLLEAATEADVLFDISGHLTDTELLAAARTRSYVDLDPGFTQSWHADPALDFRLGSHDTYVTVGFNVGAPSWPIPAAEIEWIPTLPPVVLQEWPPDQIAATVPRFTTVATWRAPYGAVAVGGRPFSLKHHQMRQMIELPERVPGAEFEIALAIDPADEGDRHALLEHGWRIVDPIDAAGTPDRFRRYLQGSSAEFSVAHGVYVETASGWFSDRTAAYLACGRPAVVQDTGLGRSLPLGGGVLPFSSLAEATRAVETAIEEAADRGEAGRHFAVENLDSDLVLTRILEAVAA